MSQADLYSLIKSCAEDNRNWRDLDTYRVSEIPENRPVVDSIPEITEYVPPEIEKTVISENATMLDTYCVKRYCFDFQRKLNHQRLLFHSNGLCILTLCLPAAPSSVCFDKNLTGNVPSGKKKRGAYMLEPQSFLCQVKGAGFETNVVSNIRGKLMEINDQLESKPELSHVDPYARGFVAVIHPTVKNYKHFYDKFSTEEEYKALLEAGKDVVPLKEGEEMENEGD